MNENVLNLYSEELRIKPGKETTGIFFSVALVCCSKTNGQDGMTVLILVLSDGFTPFLYGQMEAVIAKFFHQRVEGWGLRCPTDDLKEC